MELIFAPFLVVALFWKYQSRKGLLISLLFLAYSIGLYFFAELPRNSRIGSLFIGVPSTAYLAFMFPFLINHGEKVVKTTSVIIIMITSLLLIYFQCFVY